MNLTTVTRKAAMALTSVVMIGTLFAGSPAEAQTLPPAETRGQVYCSTDQAIAHPAAEVNKGGAPGWVYSIFYVHDSATGRWTTTNWIISYGGAGRQPSYYWMGDHWQQIDARGVVFRATPGSTQTFYELRYTQSPMIAHSNTWTYEWVYGGQCSTNLQRPW